MKTISDSIASLKDYKYSDRILQFFFLLMALFCILFFIWAYFGKLDVVSSAVGYVIPSGRVKHVQHLEGGIIKKILVIEGERVQKNQALMELEQVISGSSAQEIKLRINALKIDIIRLKAQIENKASLVFSSETKKKHPKLVKEAVHLFNTNQKSKESKLNKLSTIVSQRSQKIKTIQTNLSNKKQRLPLLKEQLALSQELLEEKLTTRYKHIEIMRSLKRIEGDIKNDESNLKEAEHALKEVKENKKEIAFSLQEKDTEKLKQTTQDFNEFSLRLQKFEDSLKRTIIKSPIKGIVKKIHFVTEGGVIKPGATIADIVPSEEKLIVEAHLSISDIGYVKNEQAAFLQLATADSRKFNKLKAKVINISPDTFTNETGQTFYNVRIESEKKYFESGKQKHMLYPGMMLMAFIHIGQRTILEYLLDPFMETLSFSMQER